MRQKESIYIEDDFVNFVFAKKMDSIFRSASKRGINYMMADRVTILRNYKMRKIEHMFHEFGRLNRYWIGSPTPNYVIYSPTS